MKARAGLYFLLIASLLSLQFSCSDEGLSLPCGTPATVVNLEDGCGFSFQLTDGTRLQPILEGCEDIFADYRREGLNVGIGFEQETHRAIYCNGAIPVRVVCLEQVLPL
jgi:hypothetical protein